MQVYEPCFCVEFRYAPVCNAHNVDCDLCLVTCRLKACSIEHLDNFAKTQTPSSLESLAALYCSIAPL